MTISLSIPQLVYAMTALILAVSIIVWSWIDIKKGVFKWKRDVLIFLFIVVILPMIPAVIVFLAVDHREAELARAAIKKAEIDEYAAMVDAIPPEWKPIIEVLHSDDLRSPAKLKVVREHVEGQIYPSLTIAQQNYIIETTFECGVCGCPNTCEKDRDRLSEIIAVYVNPWEDQ